MCHPRSKGQISRSMEGRRTVLPDTFLYSPDYLRFGDDLFTLRFSDGESPYVDINFSMFIQNDKDLPSLGYVQFDGESAYFEIHGGNFGYYQQAVSNGQTEILVQFDENSNQVFLFLFLTFWMSKILPQLCCQVRMSPSLFYLRFIRERMWTIP